MTDKYKDAIEEIVDIITIPGEDITDGECIDAIWSILKKLEYDLSAIQQQKIERK